MSLLPDISGDLAREIREAMRAGASLESLAIRIGIDHDDLANLLGEPAWRTIPDDLRAVAAVR